MELLKINFHDSNNIYGYQLLCSVIDYIVVKTLYLNLQVKHVYWEHLLYKKHSYRHNYISKHEREPLPLH